MVDAALAVAGRGFRVFPAKPGTKLPGIKNWPKKACSTPSTIRFWWDPAGRYAQANICVATGHDFIVIDFDDTNQIKPFISHYGLSPTFSVRTPSGGLHLYFKNNGTSYKTFAGNKQDGWRWPGVDVRAHGGQVLAPGSHVAGKGSYTIYRDAPVADLPPALAADLPLRSDPTVTAYENTAGSMQVTSAPLYSDIPESIPMGARDDSLFRYASSMRSRGYSREQAEALMTIIAGKCVPGEGETPESLVQLALDKLEQVWKRYPVAEQSQWVDLVSPDKADRIVTAPLRGVTDLKEALERFIFVENRNQVADLRRPTKYAVLKLEEFYNSYKNVKIKLDVDSKPVEVARVWLASRNRRTVRDVTYHPAKQRVFEEAGEHFFNAFMGNNLEKVDKVDNEKLKVFYGHMNLLFPEIEVREFFIDWLAYKIQHPHIRITWAPLIISAPGVGKGWIFQLLQRLHGRHNTIMVGPDAFATSSSFNDYLSEKMIVCVDEFKTTRKWEMMERIKSQMTEYEMEVNKKYGAKQSERIFAVFICFSNHIDAAALKIDDRRFWVHQVTSGPRDADYYRTVFDWLDTDGPAHLEAALRARNVKSFRFASAPPVTEAKRVMVEANMHRIEQMIEDAVEDRSGVFRADVVSAELVEEWVCRELDIDRLNGADINVIRHTLSSLSMTMPRHRVEWGGKTRRFRLRCLRNESFWRDKATAEDVQKEFSRASMLLLGKDPGPGLREVAPAS